MLFINFISLIRRIRSYNPLCHNPRKTHSEAPTQTNLKSTLATNLPTNDEKHTGQMAQLTAVCSMQHFIGVIKWAPSFTNVSLS